MWASCRGFMGRTVKRMPVRKVNSWVTKPSRWISSTKATHPEITRSHCHSRIAWFSCDSPAWVPHPVPTHGWSRHNGSKPSRPRHLADVVASDSQRFCINVERIDAQILTHQRMRLFYPQANTDRPRLSFIAPVVVHLHRQWISTVVCSGAAATTMQY